MDVGWGQEERESDGEKGWEGARFGRDGIM